MRNPVLVFVLLLGACWLVAQSDSSQNQASPSNNGTETTIQGCLSSSGGNYALTDKNGTVYQLSGDTAKLGDHVGHEVKVTGTENAASANTDNGVGQTDSSTQQTIQVTSFKHVAKTCQNSGTTR